MRRGLFLGALILTASAVVAFYLCWSGELTRLSFRWDTAWLLEQQHAIEVTSLWCGALGAWCVCAAALTYPRVREKVALIPVVLAVLIFLAGALATSVLRVGNAIGRGEIRVHAAFGADGAKWTVVTKTGLSPRVILLRRKANFDPFTPDLQEYMECWAPHELRASRQAGRYLVVGVGFLGNSPVAGAIVDLNVPGILADDKLPRLESLRREFGSDVLQQPQPE